MLFLRRPGGVVADLERAEAEQAAGRGGAGDGGGAAAAAAAGDHYRGKSLAAL